MSKKAQLIFFFCCLGLCVLMICGYLALIYVPSWYAPEYVAAADQQKLRDDFTDLTTRFNNHMQRPKAFDFTISAKDINRIIAGLEYIHPELKDVIPSSLMEPAVQLDDDYLKVGAVVEQSGKKVFASFWLKAAPAGEWLVIKDLKAKIGLYPVPRDTIRERLAKRTARLAEYLPLLDKILEDGRVPNRFRYPNSSYDFRVTRLRAADGVLHVTVEPISRLSTGPVAGGSEHR